METTLATWIFVVMTWLVPLGSFKDAEKKEDQEKRFLSIALDVEEVVNKTAPLFTEGTDAANRYATAALVVAVMSYESGFFRYVDFGIGEKARGPGGGQWCLGQINLGGPHARVYFGDAEMKTWTGPDLTKDRKKCVKVMVEALRLSMADCKKKGRKGADLLGRYVSIECHLGIPEARHRWGRMVEILKKFPVKL